MNRLKLLFILLCLPVLTHAQIGLSSVSPIDIDFGLKAGANFAKINDASWEKGYKGGFLGGIYAGIHTKKIGVQIEGLFSQAKYTTTGTKFYDVYKGVPGLFRNIADSAKQGDVNVSYFNIPVLFSLKLLGNAWLQLGPQYSGVISVNDKEELFNDAKGLFGNGDLSGVIGLWLNLPVGLNAGARYVIGFSDMQNTGIKETWKNRNIQLHIGYNIF